LMPGTSSIQPTHHSPSCLITAVYWLSSMWETRGHHTGSCLLKPCAAPSGWSVCSCFRAVRAAVAQSENVCGCPPKPRNPKPGDTIRVLVSSTPGPPRRLVGMLFFRRSPPSTSVVSPGKPLGAPRSSTAIRPRSKGGAIEFCPL
jgi:hypothetical protein